MVLRYCLQCNSLSTVFLREVLGPLERLTAPLKLLLVLSPGGYLVVLVAGVLEKR